MKNRIFVMLLVLSIALACSSAFASPAVALSSAESPKKPDCASGADINSARFLNMLNHNFVYGEDFENADVMVNNSVAAVISAREDDFIPKIVVTSFIKDMYGIQLYDISLLNAEYPQKQGYLYIIPKGFTSYLHSNPEITLNEDGSYFVTTTVEVTPHDGEAYTAKAVSLFVKNEASAFGYNIITSDIIVQGESLDV